MPEWFGFWHRMRIAFLVASGYDCRSHDSEHDHSTANHQPNEVAEPSS